LNPATTLSVIAATLGIAVAVLCASISRTARWREMRWFALLSAAAAVFALTDIPTTSPISPQVAAWLNRANLFAAGIHGVGWIPYVVALENRPLNRPERALIGLCLIVLLLIPIPGVTFSSTLAVHTVPWLGLTYSGVEPTALGSVAFAFCCTVLIFPIVRLARRTRQGDGTARAHVFALCLLFITAVHDSVVMVFSLPSPYLLDFGFLALVTAVGSLLVKRFIETSRSLEVLTDQLETIVAARTQALAHVERALQRAEKLAAVGQLAAGVAHEVNSPAAAIRSNLKYLREESADAGRLPPDGAECLEESLSSINQIMQIVRQLLAAGRAAANKQDPGSPFPVLATLSRAYANARVFIDEGTKLILDVPEDLHALGNPTLFEQVALNLLLNASQALAEAGRHGRIEVRARRIAQRVQITVSDDGPGIAPEVQARLFEPFTTTRHPGQGAGMGLAMSLGLMRAQGGDLSLLSSGSSGTVFAADLPWTAGPPPEDRRDAGDSESGQVGCEAPIRVPV
jgi:signal transduction histidine kinase